MHHPNGINEPVDNWYFRIISALHVKFYPRNINYMPVAKFYMCLDLERESSLINRFIN
jgi:hypothetical protein